MSVNISADETDSVSAELALHHFAVLASQMLTMLESTKAVVLIDWFNSFEEVSTTPTRMDAYLEHSVET